MYRTPTSKKHIKVMGVKINIEINDEYLREQEADGIYKNETIYLSSWYPNRKEYLRVYRHEVIHAICETLGAQLDHNCEEVLAHTISKTITYDI